MLDRFIMLLAFQMFLHILCKLDSFTYIHETFISLLRELSSPPHHCSFLTLMLALITLQKYCIFYFLLFLGIFLVPALKTLLLHLGCSSLMWFIALNLAFCFLSITLGLDVLELPLLPRPTPVFISDFDSNSPLIRVLKVQKTHTYSNTYSCY